MSEPTPRIYLDNAATSWPKPESVYSAIEDWQRRVGVSYARGTSPFAEETRTAVDQARRRVAALLGEADPARVVFTSGGTESLNLAIFGLLRPGDHVVSTVTEHNAVLRSLHQLESEGQIEATFVGCDSQGLVSAEQITAALRPNTRLVAITHASNVTGAIQPISEIATDLRLHPAKLLVDAAQSLGRVPFSVAELGADLVAAPGHKGLLGPLGTGVLWIAEDMESMLRPLRYGGAASGGELNSLPDRLPDRFEAGSLNVSGLVGLGAGTKQVLTEGLPAIRARLLELHQQLVAGLRSVPGVTIYGPDLAELQAGVVSFAVEGYDPQEFAMLLASVAGVECRAGLHCAPRLHAALGTLSAGGLVRLSPGSSTSQADIDAAISAVQQLLGASFA